MNHKKPDSKRNNTSKNFLLWLKNHQLLLIIFFAISVFILGYLGFAQSFQAMGASPSQSDLFYLSLQLFVLESGTTIPVAGWMLQFARFIAPLITIYSLIFLIFHLFHEKIREFFYQFARNHVIIFGDGQLGPILYKNLINSGYHCLYISNSKIREKTLWEKDQANGLSIVRAPTLEKILNYTSINHASHFFAVDNNDPVNIEIVTYISHLLKDDRNNPLNSYIHLNNIELSQLLKEYQLFSIEKSSMRVDFFNVFNIAGSLLLTEYSPFIKFEKCSEPPHILIIGMGRMGQSVFFNSIRKWKIITKERSKKLVVSVIDKVASEKIRRIITKYPSIVDYADIYQYDIDIESSEFLEGKFLVSSTYPYFVSNVFICLSNESQGLVYAIEIYKMLQKRAPEYGLNVIDIPIIVRTLTDSGFTHIFKKEMDFIDPFRCIYPFPVLEKTCNPALIFNGYYELIARSIHEQYLTHQLSLGLELGSHVSLVPWNELSDAYKESSRKQADDIIRKIHSIHCIIRPIINWDDPRFVFTQIELEKLAVLEHERWFNEKKLQGWIYGQYRNDKERTHPCLIPWNDLPEDEKDKDRNAIMAIPQLLELVELRIQRI